MSMRLKRSGRGLKRGVRQKLPRITRDMPQKAQLAARTPRNIRSRGGVGSIGPHGEQFEIACALKDSVGVMLLDSVNWTTRLRGSRRGSATQILGGCGD